MRVRNFVLILSLLLLALAAKTGAAEQFLINYQGRLVDEAGAPVDATMPMAFKILADSTGESTLWSEEHDEVRIKNGLFTVLLGSVVQFELDMFERYPLWLVIRTEAGEASPIRMVSTTHSMRSFTSNAANFASTIANNSVNSSKIANGSIQLTDIGQNGATDGQVMAWQDGVGWQMADAASGAGDITSVTAGSGLSGGGTTGDVTVSIGVGNITSDMIAYGAVTVSQLANNSVNTSKIANGSVTNDKLASNAVTSTRIANNTITNADISSTANISTSKIAGTAATLHTSQTFTEQKSFSANTGMGTTTPGSHQLSVLSSDNSYDGATILAKNTGANGTAFMAENTSSQSTVVIKQHGSGSIMRCDSDQGGWHVVMKLNNRGLIVKGDGSGYAGDFTGNVAIRKVDGTLLLELGDGLDYAEGFDVTNESEVKPGMVLVIDPQAPGQLALSTQAYDRKVAGIVAGANELGSGVRIGAGQFDHDVALAGRVYCYVDASFGAIELGDLLTTSPIPGHAMVVKDYAKAQGAILGKAMETMPAGERGQILVLVTLQ